MAEPGPGSLVTRPWASYEANLLVSPLQVKGLQASKHHLYLNTSGKPLL